MNFIRSCSRNACKNLHVLLLFCSQKLCEHTRLNICILEPMNACTWGYLRSNYEKALVKLKIVGVGLKVVLRSQVCLNREVGGFSLVLAQMKVLCEGVVISDTFLEDI